jgi:hypothetical protein
MSPNRLYSRMFQGERRARPIAGVRAPNVCLLNIFAASILRGSEKNTPYPMCGETRRSDALA